MPDLSIVIMVALFIKATEMRSSRKNPYPPQGRSLEIPRGRGILKTKIIEVKYEDKLEFPGGRGVQNKKLSMGAVWTISGTAQCTYTQWSRFLELFAELLLNYHSSLEPEFAEEGSPSCPVRKLHDPKTGTLM